MSTKKPIPRRKRFTVRVVETHFIEFRVLAMTQNEAEQMASAMVDEEEEFPYDAEVETRYEIVAWKGKP